MDASGQWDLRGHVVEQKECRNEVVGHICQDGKECQHEGSKAVRRWLEAVLSRHACHQELDQGMRRWASWWLALQQPAGGRSQMADGEGREGRWWPVGGLARTKPAALRATRLHPCVVTLGLASNTPRRRPAVRRTTRGLRPPRVSVVASYPTPIAKRRTRAGFLRQAI